MSEETKQNKGRRLVDRKLFEAPGNFIAGRPEAALKFWFFGDFRCGMWLFTVLLVRYKDRKQVNVRLAGDHLCGKMAVYLAVAGGVLDGALLCALPFPRRYLG